jgi:hypothetical protein
MQENKVRILAGTVLTLTRTIDTEVYPDYFLVQFDNPIESFELYEGHPLDVMGLHTALSTCRTVGFNSNHFDMPMITLALAGADNARLKQGCDEIIQGNMLSWQFYDRWRLNRPDYDHIDLIEIAPGRDSLKVYGGKMHSRKLQDLPIDPSQSIAPDQRRILREYCGNDLRTTRDLYETFPAQIKLREEMTEEYGIDLRSKSDAQIAEAIMKKLTGVKYRVEVPTGTQFYYRPPPWMYFQTLNVLDLIARSPFTVASNGSVEMTPELEKTNIRIGKSVYHMGIGGLHSTEKNAVHVADETYSLQDVDVESYYPALAIQTGIFPPAIGPQFCSIYKGWRDRRVLCKRAGDKKNADSLKTVLNGTFGKLGSKWSIFYAPSEFVQVTVGGQLQLLMLIEALELAGISVVSANTDGIVIKCRRDIEWMRDQIVAWWCGLTGFKTEAVNYRAICSRDINNYIAIGVDGKVKRKGTFAPPVPVATSWPNPTGEICQDALVEYLTKGTPLDQTIRSCQDIRKFVHVRKVAGGGIWARESGSEYLGKAVRWYFATGDTAPIIYRTNGNKVANSDGCRPLMELPDVIPGDIDYPRYLSDAREMLTDLGVQG